MEYKQLTEALIPEYLAGIQEMKKIFSSFKTIEIREIGDGNLNYVYAVSNREKPEETVILKQAVPFLRCAGESSPLSIERMNFEIMALKKEYELCPDFVPEVYYSDKDMALVIMQNLSQHRILRGEMNQGKVFPKLADDLSTFMARTLFYSSDWYLDPEVKKREVAGFINTDLCKLTENFIFTHPFYKSETNVYNPELSREDIDYIQNDPALKVAVSDIKRRFMNSAEAMLHGDLHTGSVMINEDETYIIDPEFAFYGPAGFDIALFLGNMSLAYLAHSYRQSELLGREPYAYRKWILDTIREIWNGFAAKYDRYWKEHQDQQQDPLWDFPAGETARVQMRQQEIRRIFTDAVGIAGCVMIRRTLGLAKVSDIAELQDLKARARIDRMALRMGKELIMRHQQYTTIDALTDVAMKISPLV